MKSKVNKLINYYKSTKYKVEWLVAYRKVPYEVSILNNSETPFIVLEGIKKEIGLLIHLFIWMMKINLELFCELFSQK